MLLLQKNNMSLFFLCGHFASHNKVKFSIVLPAQILQTQPEGGVATLSFGRMAWLVILIRVPDFRINSKMTLVMLLIIWICHLFFQPLFKFISVFHLYQYLGKELSIYFQVYKRYFYLLLVLEASPFSHGRGMEDLGKHSFMI